MYSFNFKIKRNSIWKRKIPIFWLVVVFVLASIGTAIFSIKTVNEKFESYQPIAIPKKPKKLMSFEKIERPKPKPVSMDRLKKQGCVADGLLSEYNPDREQYIDLINRSNCYYLHRAIETWLTPPDFETIEYVMGRISKKDVVYGMFIAEALKTNAQYSDNEGRQFDFDKMCQSGSQNTWGEHSCKPDFGSGEYRDYLKYITHRAIDLGIQNFMFGQIYYQQGGGGRERVEEVVKEMRTYAKKQKVNIVIGAQTGKITDPEFLSLFDYIEGGTGIDESGNLPSGPCLDRWGGCWGLLWDNAYSRSAKNVLLHLDWSGIPNDDLDIFARMSQEQRANTLRNLYSFYTSRNMGFLMPFFGVLDKDNGGCFGPKKRFYSPDNAYSCKDEAVINDILKKGWGN